MIIDYVCHGFLFHVDRGSGKKQINFFMREVYVCTSLERYYLHSSAARAAPAASRPTTHRTTANNTIHTYLKQRARSGSGGEQLVHH